MKLYAKCALLVFAIIFSSGAFSQPTLKQKKDQLQMQMKKLQDEIKNIEAVIKKTSAKKEKSQSEILSLQAKIRSREKLIRNINSQIGEIEETITQTENEIATEAAQVEKLKAEYAKTLRQSYSNLALQNKIYFLFSSNSFFDALRRYNYLLRIAEYRRGQAKALQESIASLEHKKEDLENTKVEKVGLLNSETAQKLVLVNEKKEKDDAVAKLQEKETKLRKQVEDKNKQAQQLSSKIQAIIEEEIRIAKKKAEEEAKKKTAEAPVKKGAETMPLTPEERALSVEFASNKGKLPWPVVRGHVVSPFGKHEHPLLKQVWIDNNGVDIKTEKGAQARSIFGGTVVSIFFLPTYQNCVMIKHGEYFTVYSNIETVTVKTNQTVAVKQSLGTLHTEKGDELTKVHLEIWKGKDKMDPELWLAD